MIRSLFIALLCSLPATSSWASGFYLPWWAEAASWLLLTYEGWAVMAVAVVALVFVVYEAVRK